MSDSYNAYDADITRRLEHSETRIKNWVIGGILANLMVLIGVGLPMVYYLGGIQNQTLSMLANSTAADQRMDRFEKWMTQREIWEANISSQMSANGMKPAQVPHYGDSNQ